MDRVDLGTIRRASVGSIFELLSGGESLTRAQLAARSGLSLMTVGKAVDLLGEAAALVQQKEESRSSGRKSSLCSLDIRRGAMVYDFSSEPSGAFLYTVDMLTRIKAKYSLSAEDIPDAQEIFAGVSAEAFFSLAQDGEPLGRGLILPDRGSDTALGRFDRLNGGSADIAETSVRTAALAASPRGESSSVYFRLGNDLKVSSGALVENCRLCRGFTGSAGDLGGISEIGLSEAVRIICCLLDPETVRFELPVGCDMKDGLSERLCGRGIKAKLDFVGFAPERSVAGMTKLLISAWLDQICR